MQTTKLCTRLVFSTATSNRISISDVDAAASSVQVTLTVTNGTLTLAGTAGLAFTAGDGTADATMTLHIGDAETMGPYVGRDEVMRHFTDHHEIQTDQRRHVVTNVTLERDEPTEARTTSVLTLFVVEGGAVRVQATGVYRDHFVEEDGGWRIRERVLRLDAHY